MDQELRGKREVYDVVIIGGGPAGLTAGLYTARARLSTLLIEKLGVGGQAAITDMVENYPGFIGGISGPELVHNMEEQAKSFGMWIVSGEVSKIDCSNETHIKRVFVTDGPEPYQCLSIIIAAGNEQRKLGVPGEEEYTGKGVSYCATCDGAFFRDLPVALVGGGDVAIQEALFLTRFVKRIHLIHRRDRLRATKVLQERAFSNSKIEFILNSVVDEVFGSATVEGIKVRNLRTGDIKALEVSGVFVFIGWTPSPSFVGDRIMLNKEGYIMVDREMRTSGEGVFACGDCCEKNLRQIVTACGDGATAAFSAQHYVERIKGEEYT